MAALDEFDKTLAANNVPYEAKDIPHGRQFRFPDGAILNAYASGKQVWQGADSPTRARVTEILGFKSVGDIAKVMAATTPVVVNQASNKVFVVYGHDVEAREQLELLLRRMRLEPVILQNLPIKGDTIIEKLEGQLDAHYACVLLTPDDEGHRLGEDKEKKHRARQNVVLELGMFLAKLGRKRVAILYKGDIELPSDVQGLIYIKFKKRVDEVKERLAAELQEAGFQINIKDLLS